MARAIMRSLMFLSVIILISVILISSHLFSNNERTNQHVHLVHSEKHINVLGGLHADRLFEFNQNELRDENWLQEFVLNGDIAQPQHQDARIAMHKFDTDSASLPNSDDDWGDDEAAVKDTNKNIRDGDESNIGDTGMVKALNGGPRKTVISSKISDRVADIGKLNIDIQFHEQNLNRTCKPLNSIAMIKTHKCSSSTLQNILMRRSEDLDLSMGIPKEGVYLGSPSFFTRRYIFLDDGIKRYDIMASHMRFRSPSDVQAVMAKDAKYVTILRDPARQYESMYTYYGWKQRFKVDLRRFLQRPDRYFGYFEPRRPRTAGRNPMCYDNGLDARMLDEADERVEHFITVLDSWFDLVLIAEYFDESLILLKDLMCWTLDDIVYFSQNARNKDSVVPLSRADKEAIRHWNWADTKLYNYFNETLMARIEIYGKERMQHELRELQLKKTALGKDCIGETVDEGDRRMWYPPGIKVNSFLLNEGAQNRHLCDQLTRPELVFLKQIRKKQIADLPSRRRLWLRDV